MTEFTLPVDRPFAWTRLLRVLDAHSVVGIDSTDLALGTHSCVVPTRGGPAVATMSYDGDVTISVTLRDGRGGHRIGETGVGRAGRDHRDPAASAISRLLDLDRDPTEIDDRLRADSRLSPLVQAHPGTRVVGSIDGFATSVTTVLGQQVSLRAARTFAARLVAAYGNPVEDQWATFPEPAVLAAADPAEIAARVGLTAARGRSVHALATAVADGLDIAPDGDLAATRAALLAISGIGPWTVEYIALRALGDTDAYPAGDLVLRRAIEASTTAPGKADHSNGWRPFRAYAVTHLWNSQLF